MEESTTYQWVLEQGALRQARKNVLLLGKQHFSRTPRAVKTALENITDLARLEELILRLGKAESWEELLGLPQPVRRSTRRKPKS